LRVLDASFIARVLTLKGLETDTLYLVFKHRVQIVIWIALQTTLTRPKQTGILTNDLRPVKQSGQYSSVISGETKAPQYPRNAPRISDTKGRHKFPVLKPLDASPKEEWAL
jgi:hypothetical protein